jgi:uncharacterized damage-inducible protein DinB
MTSETERIVRMLEKTFDRQPWYGSSIMDILEMNPGITSHRIGNGHTIIELVRHMTSWRTFATRRLEGDNSFEITEELNFPQPGTWEQAIIQLRQSQEALVRAAKNFPEDRLGELVPSKTQKYTYYTLLHGIMQHDIYHLGQIAMLKKG